MCKASSRGCLGVRGQPPSSGDRGFRYDVFLRKKLTVLLWWPKALKASILAIPEIQQQSLDSMRVDAVEARHPCYSIARPTSSVYRGAWPRGPPRVLNEPPRPGINGALLMPGLGPPRECCVLGMNSEFYNYLNKKIDRIWRYWKLLSIRKFIHLIISKTSIISTHVFDARKQKGLQLSGA